MDDQTPTDSAKFSVNQIRREQFARTTLFMMEFPEFDPDGVFSRHIHYVEMENGQPTLFHVYETTDNASRLVIEAMLQKLKASAENPEPFIVAKFNQYKVDGKVYRDVEFKINDIHYYESWDWAAGKDKKILSFQVFVNVKD